MTNQTVKILGWLYGRLEFITYGYDGTNIVSPEMRPLTSYVEIHKRAITARTITKGVEKQIRELMDAIDIDEFERVTSPEAVIPLEQQGIWQLAYYKGVKNTPLTVGYNIAAKREAKGISQRELAELLEVSQPAVAKWESGKSTPTPENMEKIKAILE